MIYIWNWWLYTNTLRERNQSYLYQFNILLFKINILKKYNLWHSLCLTINVKVLLLGLFNMCHSKGMRILIWMGFLIDFFVTASK